MTNLEITSFVLFGIVFAVSVYLTILERQHKKSTRCEPSASKGGIK